MRKHVADVPGQDKRCKTGEELDGAKQDKHHCFRACQVHPPGGEGHEVDQDKCNVDDQDRMTIMMIVTILMMDGAFLTHPHCNQGIFLHLN